MTDGLGGTGDRVALEFGERRVRYDELARAVAAAGSAPADGPIGCRGDGDPIDTAIAVLAALAAHRPVLIGGGTDDAARLAPSLPPGTGLAVMTSGSSSRDGRPRVIARTAASWTDSFVPFARVAGLDAGDRVAITGPLVASMHLFAVLQSLAIGATATDRVHDATAVHATPTRLARLLHADALAPGTRAIVAGASLPDAVRASALHRGIRLVEYYGAAELSLVLAARDDGVTGGLHPFPGVEVDLRPTADGLLLWARSPFLALDVVGGGLRRDADGFATVGDLAERTLDGGIRVLGRGDSAITTAGATVLAEDVEARLATLAGVHDAAVVGTPHRVLGQRIAALVELAPGTDLAEVAAAARTRLGPAELPRRWYAGTLPRTATGKPARGLLREQIASGAFGPGHPPAAEGARP
ncbi:AMP-binding enzyme [Agromyces marinus]|uniref:AMP-binding enzyme n=1 Tax=Agromyces marinus TaxID=1389020 RepID=UPI001F2F50DA|nr:long-chain fatty acid--CoA ligase [Agromyces marinus]UIP58991.1 Acetyl-coenzyme A synthetase [Agromyces marinus]